MYVKPLNLSRLKPTKTTQAKAYATPNADEPKILDAKKT